ncbi:MAG: hypothetical protein REI94_08215 [Moraxellaceae bacterium]|nr:hypothetical protein [Moraxellaceae bacterium]
MIATVTSIHRCARALLLLSGLLLWQVIGAGHALAACNQGICVSAGPRLASIDSTHGALLNALLGSLLNSSVNLSVADWNAVAQTNVKLGLFLNALQAQTSTASHTAALGATTTLAKILTAGATAATADNATAATALNSLAGQVNGLSGTIAVGQMLNVSLPTGMFADTRVNLLDLVTGNIQLFNYQNMLTTPSPINLTGAALGLSGILNSVALYAQIIEPPVMRCGAGGTTFHTAAVRIKLNIDLIDVALDVSSLIGIGGVLGASASLAQLQLYVEVARANGTINTLNALTNAVSIQASPGVADIYLGQVSDAVFASDTPLTAGVVQFANIGALNVTLPVVGTLNLAIQAKSTAHGNSSSTALNFSGPWPQTQTASTSAFFVSNLLSSLLTNLQLQLSPTLAIDALLLAPLKPILVAVLNGPLGTLLSSLVDPLLGLLGVQLGQMQVTVTGSSYACTLSGFAYSDANHSASRDGGEAGCGQALWAKLVPAASPAGPALEAVTVDPTTGAYSFATVVMGSYNVVLDTNATLADVTPGNPAGWLGTEAPTGVRGVTLGAADLPVQNFGLYNGSRLGGTVFKDNGSGGGTANNGLREAGESLLAGVSLRATDNAGTTTHDTTTTDTAGSFTLWIPASVGTGVVKIVETNLPAYTSVAGSAGNTGGSYAIAQDTLSFTHSVGSIYSGVLFADVPVNVFNEDNQQTILPGATASHPHDFVAGTAGQLSLGLSGTATPAASWAGVLFRDSNCNATLDAGEPQVSAPIAVVADQRLCFIVRATAPPSAPYNAQYAQTLAASFTYANSVLTWSGNRQDLTFVGNASDAGLVLIKTVDKATAQPGETLVYVIRYENRSSGVLGNLKLYDATPAYTVFAAASCGTVPSGISNCQVTAQPAVGARGAVNWTLTGTLAPGLFGTVTYSVVLQ